MSLCTPTLAFQFAGYHPTPQNDSLSHKKHIRHWSSNTSVQTPTFKGTAKCSSKPLAQCPRIRANACSGPPSTSNARLAADLSFDLHMTAATCSRTTHSRSQQTNLERTGQVQVCFTLDTAYPQQKGHRIEMDGEATTLLTRK